MKLHIMLDSFSIEKHKQNISSQDNIVCSKGLASRLSNFSNVIELTGVPETRELALFAKQFKEEFFHLEWSKDLTCTSQMNDIFKFILVDVFEITKVIAQNKVDVIYLYDGNEKVNFISIYLAANTEVANPLFSRRSRILNPILMTWLSGLKQTKTFWREESKFKLNSLKVIRNTCIFTISLISCLRSLNYRKIETSASHIVLFRTCDQFENLKYIEKLYPDATYVRGPFIANKAKIKTATLISIKTVILSLIDCIKIKYQELLAAEDNIAIEVNGYDIILTKRAILNESAYLLTSLAYYRGLKCLSEVNCNIRYIYTSEVTSRYALIEKIARDNLFENACLVGIQFISVGNIMLPCFPVQDKFLAKSKVDFEILASLYSVRNIEYVGNFLLSNKMEFLATVETKKIIAFYTQPYGHHDNLEIVNSVLATLPNDWSFIIRSHPRDNFRYEKLSKLIQLDKNQHYLDTLAASSVVISKSSSILVEAIELKKTTLPIAVDKYTQGVIKSIVGEILRPVLSFEELTIRLEQAYSIPILSSSLTRDTVSFVSKSNLERVIFS